MSEVIQSYIGSVHLKVLNLEDSEAFYDRFYQVMSIDRKDKNEDYVGYWGNFGIVLTEQQNHLINVPNENKTAIAKISIFVSMKDMVDKIYTEMHKHGYLIIWKPQPFEYSKGYYSTCIADPDDNYLEIFYSEPEKG